MTAVGHGDGRTLTVFLIAGEESGDQLGARLMEALQRKLAGRVRFLGVGGDRMAQLGLVSLFPMAEVGLHGITAVIANLGRILKRMSWIAGKVVEADPDVLVIIDVPGFNLGVARRVRRQRPAIPIVQYVSPTVWVWRPGRARWMKGFVDRIMAILPFEPETHRRLGGPPCTYVGHPLVERLSTLRPGPGERAALTPATAPVLLVLPGSRAGEVSRLTETFGAAVGLVRERLGRPVEVLLPAVPRFVGEIRQRVASWPVQPTIVEGEAAKFAAFRRAHAALAASGTVTLELALAEVPMVVAYRVDALARLFKWVLRRINSFVLPNLILGSNEIPEFLDSETTPENLAAALLPLLDPASPERTRQLTAFSRLDRLLVPEGGMPSELAAEIVLANARPLGTGGAGQRRLEIGI